HRAHPHGPPGPTRPHFAGFRGRHVHEPPRRGVRCPALSGLPLHGRRLALVDQAFRTLPERYLGAEAGFDATYHIRLGDIGHTWEVRATTHGARVRKGLTNRRPDV